MRFRTSLTLALALLITACQTAPARGSAGADPAARAALFSMVSALEGRWQTTGPDGGPASTVFAVSSGGSAVREVMLEGSDHEMTNMYTLDGGTLLMTHYCAGGNQPSMRAAAVEGDRVVFHFDGVRDLESPDQAYMGEMTLVRVDDDHVEQHWRAYRGDELDHEMTIELQRR